MNNDIGAGPGEESDESGFDFDSLCSGLGDREIAEQLLVDGLLKERSLDSDEAVNARVNRLLVSLPADNPRRSSPRNWPSAGRSIIGLAVAASIVFVVVMLSSADGEKELGQLVVHESGVRVASREGGDFRLIEAGESIALRSGQVVRTSRSLDSAEVVYVDGTKVDLLGRTHATFGFTDDGAKKIQITSGLIQADVAAQPEGLPLRILTPTATLEVLGTSLGVDVEAEATQLEVASGVVSMTRDADGDQVNVSAGQLATATRSTATPLRAETFPELPEVWSQSFDEGLPEGWWAGELIETAAGSAVRAAGDGRGKENNIAITTQNAWREGTHGLFSLRADSVLHIRFRQERVAPLRLMLTTRSYPPNSAARGVNLYYEDSQWNADLEPETWRTISVPLARASYFGKRRRFESGTPELKGLAAFILQFSSLDQDIGLTVERIWVTR